jgi:hypothetical protein
VSPPQRKHPGDRGAMIENKRLGAALACIREERLRREPGRAGVRERIWLADRVVQGARYFHSATDPSIQRSGSATFL